MMIWYDIIFMQWKDHTSYLQQFWWCDDDDDDDDDDNDDFISDHYRHYY